jgi:hypothetical protein
MNTINFDALQSVDKANTKVGTPKGQNFDVRFRKFYTKKGGEKPETKFFISDKVWDELGLDVKALKQFNEKDESGKIARVFLGVVSNEEGIILRKTDKLKENGKKGRNFKSTLLEDALVEAGVLNAELIGTNQRLQFVSVGENNGVKFYQVVADANQATDDDAVEESVSDEAATVSAPATDEEF